MPTLPIQWCGRKSTRNQYRALRDIAPDISRDEVDRRILAFGVGHFGISPTATLHGYRFRYEPARPAESNNLTASHLVPEPA